jgi:hypothetical protein
VIQLPAIASLAFHSPTWLVVVLVLLAVSAVPWVALRAYRGTEPRVFGGQRALLVTLRALALLTLILMLAEPVLFQSRSEDVHPSLLVLVDNSASMGIATPGGGTRYEEAMVERGRIATVVREQHRDTPLWFGEGSRRLEHSTRGAAASGEGPTGEGTDLRALLVSATQRHLEDELAGIVLLSDGVITSTETRASLAGLNVPVWAVAVGDSAGLSDLGLSRVRYPSRVPRGDRLAIEGEVVVRSALAGATSVRLRRGTVPVDSLSVVWEPGTSRHPFEFVVDSDSVGYARYEIDLEPLDDETVIRNNRIQVGVRVEKDRLRVLQFSSRPGWDTHFMRNAAARDPRIEWTTVYRTPAGMRVAGTDSTLVWPMDAEALAAVDLFVATLSEDLVMIGAGDAGVLEAVRSGAGLWIVAGDASDQPAWPSSIRSVAPLVPGRRARWIPTEARAELPAEARSHPVWALAPEAGGLDESLGRVPPLQARIMPMDLSGEADVLLRTRGAGGQAPILAARQVGQGRVVVWNGAPFWSWSFWQLGDEGTQPFFGALIGNLVTWMAEGGDRERLRLQIPRPVVARGEAVELRALALDPQMRPDAKQDVWLEWAPADADSIVAGRVRMAPDTATPGARSAELPSLAAGEYLLRATLEENSSSLHSSWEPLTVDAYSVEFRDPRVDRLRLASLARATGGDLLSGPDLAPWARSLELDQRQRISTGRIDLGSRLWLLIPLLGFLSVEWALRKRAGLI